MKFEIRRAGLADVSDIAAAHLDSIRSIGPKYYDPAIVGDWSARIADELYIQAMSAGEVFYIAVAQPPDKAEVLGFSSYRREDDEHRTAVYVRGSAARSGVGSALFHAAEASAIAAGARSIDVSASLAAMEFYRVNGFEELGRGEHRLATGRTMPCVFMRKKLTNGPSGAG